MDSAGAIDSLQKVIWDRLREECCHGRVPEGALEVVWEPFLDLQGSKNDALKRSSDDFFGIVVKNGPSNCFFYFFELKFVLFNPEVRKCLLLRHFSVVFRKQF